MVRLEGVEPGRLLLSGIDLLDGTPVLDIKPYVPYADSVVGASNLTASEAPVAIAVGWSANALPRPTRMGYALASRWWH